MSERVIPLFVAWESTVKDLLMRTAKMPKNLRFTLTSRIDNLALDVFERLIEARYSRGNIEALRAANIAIEKLRLLIRLCHELGSMDHRGFEHVMRNLDEAGRMIGGWIKQQNAER